MSFKLFALSFLIISSYENISAQYTLASAGGEASGAGGSISYSVGQVSYTYAQSGAGSLSAGVQQTYEISEVTGVAEIDAMLISVFPTRVTGFLSVIAESNDLKPLEYRLFDLNGKLVRSGKIRDRMTKIFVGDLVKSTYLIEIFNGNNTARTFKFIKN